jgi:hypothetical protein
MPLFGHHMHGYLEVQVMGREFPDGPTEHALAFGGMAVAAALMLYGLIALLRDVLRWRKPASKK